MIEDCWRAYQEDGGSIRGSAKSSEGLMQGPVACPS